MPRFSNINIAKYKQKTLDICVKCFLHILLYFLLVSFLLSVCKIGSERARIQLSEVQNAHDVMHLAQRIGVLVTHPIVQDSESDTFDQVDAFDVVFPLVIGVPVFDVSLVQMHDVFAIVQRNADGASGVPTVAVWSKHGSSIAGIGVLVKSLNQISLRML